MTLMSIRKYGAGGEESTVRCCMVREVGKWSALVVIHWAAKYVLAGATNNNKWDPLSQPE